ncbi:methyltransferase domain-containing protein [Polyangium spumosum]|uniref:Methyltransferase domain-containing protein n=1 Tax=Polyangium spumosum TaxID=889282 RepID=A0A6N7PT20_9BACT|nr:methyltransferase domain-containing protein [Polyangium spumosum]MRG93194.1 methyltransferase domain-containing protein [Polyangium spumosum]
MTDEAPPPDTKPRAAYIHGTSEEEQRRLAELNGIVNAEFVGFLDVKPEEQVLEVGSGLGILTRLVAARVPLGMVWGVERSEVQIDYALRELDKLPEDWVPNVTFLQGDAHALPFEDGSFDVVYCRFVLEHVADPARVLQEMHRVLRPGGRFFMQEPNARAIDLDPECPLFDNVWTRFLDVQRTLGGDPVIGKRLYRLARRAGFVDISLSISPMLAHAGHDNFRAYVMAFADVLRTAEDLLRKHDFDLDEVRDAVRELDAFAEHPDAALYFYWNRATGRRAP